MKARQRARIVLQLAFAVVAAASSAVTFAARPPGAEAFDEVALRHVDEAYVQPGAEFAGYSRVMIDPAMVAFRRDWLRNLTRERDLAWHLDADDTRAIADQTRSSFDDVFPRAFARAGYGLATEAAPDVLRLTPRIVDLYVNAPDVPTAVRTHTYTSEAGSARLVVEIRDSMSGRLLGIAVDQRRTRSSTQGVGIGADRLGYTTSVTNRSDFAALFRTWARVYAHGLDRLKRR